MSAAPSLASREPAVALVEEVVEPDQLGDVRRSGSSTRGACDERQTSRAAAGSRAPSAAGRGATPGRRRRCDSRTRSPSRTDVVSRARGRFPASKGSTVVRHPIVVDLPAPFVPTNAKTPPSVDRERDVVHGDLVAVSLGERRRPLSPSTSSSSAFAPDASAVDSAGVIRVSLRVSGRSSSAARAAFSAIGTPEAAPRELPCQPPQRRGAVEGRQRAGLGARELEGALGVIVGQFGDQRRR